ncbi:MAG: HEAT repeat domain-containing protein [Nannocystaceae bacterium]|nr:HEAT repeat domain-containing protein [Nannocystaceae bacterium]
MRDRAALRIAVADPGFTPSEREAAALLELLGEDEHARAATRALLRIPAAARAAVTAGFETLVGAARAGACELVGRLAREHDATLAPWLVERLRDADASTRRRAATALGKLEDPQFEAPLLAAWSAADSASERRAIVAALGQSGDAGAQALLAELAQGPWVRDDAELARIVGEAQLKLAREQLRREPSSIALDVALDREVELALSVRRGFEPVLAEELAALGLRPRVGNGALLVRSAGPLRRLLQARTFLQLSIVLPPVRVGAGGLEAAIVRALASDTAQQVLLGWTHGPIRWRLHWHGAGHRRGATFRVAAAVAELVPALVNDAREAPWQVQVTVQGDRVAIELQPRLDDPRFAWRRGAVPASSHPTVAAALAHVAGAAARDVVWDPFVGAGAELIERARLGPYRALFGSDLDDAALAIAADNLAAAGVADATLTRADARRHRPALPPTLVLTNPPMGHRVRAGGAQALGELLDAALSSWLQQLVSDRDARGRIVWLSPVPERTAANPRARVVLRRAVDLNGLAAELQVLQRREDSAPAHRRSRARSRQP